jgi:trigger factor
MINLDTVEGENVQQVFHHVRFEVSKARMASWMKTLVAGAKTGDVLEGLSEPDETATEEEKQEFKPKKVRVTILKVEEAVLPEVNDDFAKKVGAADAVHMRESITRLLNNQADDKVKTELREQVNDYLIEKYSFELPQSLIDTEIKHRFHQLMQDPKFKRNWDPLPQEEKTALWQKLDNESAQAVRLFYLSRQVVREANIPITHQEVQNEAVSIYQSHGGKQGDHMPKELHALALSKIILAKAQDLIIGNKKA